MAHGLQDWTLSTTPTVITADKLDNGLDADKSASPEAGAVYYARDTKILYLCAAAGTWTGIDAASLVEGVLTLYANMVAGGYKITGLGAPTVSADAARKSEVDAEATARVADVDAEETARIAADAVITGKLDDVTQAQPTRALGTTYRNTGGKIRIVTVSAYVTAEAAAALIATCDAAAAPTTIITRWAIAATGSINAYGSLTFIVPVNYYYKVTQTNMTLYKWTEWDLL